MTEHIGGVGALFDALSGVLGERIARDPVRLESCAWDFGGLVRKFPALVAEPSTADEVATVLALARDHGTPVAVRGSGHSQSGQCLSEGSLVLQTHRLGGVNVDPEREIVVAGGGATWRDVFDRAFAYGLVPLGPTYITDPTVAGTLSVGGVGAESIRRGAQVNNVLYVDVATIDGRVLRCSPTENTELFDAVRAGLGQFGVIVRAAYPLRRCKPRVRTHFFSYDDASAFIADLIELQTQPRSEWVGGFVTRGEQRGHVILLALGKEFAGDDASVDEVIGAGLHAAKVLPHQDAALWDASGIPGHLFFRMHTGKGWTETAGAPSMVHPWVDHLFTTEVAAEVLASVLARPPAPLRMGTCGIIPVVEGGRRSPLLRVPPSSGGLHIGLGMFPNVPRGLRADAVEAMRAYSSTLCASGGTRYLSGFVDFSRAAWAEHFGEAWPWACDMKRRFNPQGLLNPGFPVFG